MGVNVGRYYLATFALGSLLAALAGAFTAPTVSVVPGLGVEVIVLSFAVVVIGGLGSLPGAAVGAVMVGLVRSLSVHYMINVDGKTVYACITRLTENETTLEPLPNKTLIRDLVTEIAPPDERLKVTGSSGEPAGE